jgi:hypothetical protein
VSVGIDFGLKLIWIMGPLIDILWLVRQPCLLINQLSLKFLLSDTIDGSNRIDSSSPGLHLQQNSESLPARCEMLGMDVIRSQWERC